jgi:hypothetical protein
LGLVVFCEIDQTTRRAGMQPFVFIDVLAGQQYGSAKRDEQFRRVEKEWKIEISA